MYGKNLRQAMRGIIDEQGDLIRGADGKRLTTRARNILIDKILWELWMRGYAVSARTPDDKAYDRDRSVHDAWRATKS